MADTVDMTAGTAQTIVGGAVKISNTIDLNEASAKNVIATAGALATTDIIQCLDIPAGMHVKNVFTKIVRAATGTTLTCSVGDADSAAGWNANTTNLKAALGTIECGVGGTDALVTAGKLYAAADTIDLTLNTVTSITDWPTVLVTADCFDPTAG
jgi:hypothetical protein